jgi:hypothetical protein
VAADATTPRRGGSRPGAGRKPLGARKKPQQSVTLTPAAWRWLTVFGARVGADNLSQAIEKALRSHPLWSGEDYPTDD